jgi:hypothetical protein
LAGLKEHLIKERPENLQEAALAWLTSEGSRFMEQEGLQSVRKELTMQKSKPLVIFPPQAKQ